MKIPEKLSVRLDFTVKEMLAKYLEKKINRTASQTIRSALRRFLEEELQAMALEVNPPNLAAQYIAKFPPPIPNAKGGN